MKQVKLDADTEEIIYGSLWEMVCKAQVVTFIGAGGKTTCLNRLTWEIDQAGYPVIAATTTKVYPQAFPSHWQNAREFPFLEMVTPCFWYAGIEQESGKWQGISIDVLDSAIRKESTLGKGEQLELQPRRFWVIEGDGAREHRLKCWASHEPQIPRSTEAAVLVIDGHLWGKTLKKTDMHRSEICSDLVGKVWNPELAWQYILSSPVFSQAYRELSWFVLFNVWGKEHVEQEYDELRELKKLGEKFLTQTQEHFYENLHSRLPQHLRLSSGNAKEGNLRWYDLW